MSVVSRNLDVGSLYAQRRVYTAPEQCGYSGLPYLNPNNLNEKIYEDEYPPEYAMPNQVPYKNAHAPPRKPSDNLTIHMDHVPLQFQTYDLADSRRGASVFNAPIPNYHPKLRTPAQIATASDAKNLTKDQISFHSEYAKIGQYPAVNAALENIASLIDTRRPTTKVLYSDVAEPTGMVFKEPFNYKKAHRNVNAVALAPETQAQEALRHFARTGSWF